ncbi:MAG: winged helix-turn-helix domain-containing protein [Planctomycetota bacterium]
MSTFRPKYRHVVRTASEHNALRHPTAGALIQLMQEQEMTLTQAADRLGMKAGHLQYYLRRLVQAKLVKLVRKKDIGRNVEKYYRAIAYRFSLPAKNERTPETERMCVEMMAGAIAEYAARMHRTDGDWTGAVNRVRLLPEDLEEIRKQVERLIIKYRRKRLRNKRALDYRSVWVMFPLKGVGGGA